MIVPSDDLIITREEMDNILAEIRTAIEIDAYPAIKGALTSVFDRLKEIEQLNMRGEYEEIEFDELGLS